MIFVDAEAASSEAFAACVLEDLGLMNIPGSEGIMAVLSSLDSGTWQCMHCPEIVSGDMNSDSIVITVGPHRVRGDHSGKHGAQNLQAVLIGEGQYEYRVSDGKTARTCNSFCGNDLTDTDDCLGGYGAKTTSSGASCGRNRSLLRSRRPVRKLRIVALVRASRKDRGSALRCVRCRFRGSG